MNTPIDLNLAQSTCAAHGNRPDALLEILHDIQEHKGFVPQADLPVIAKALNLSRADVHGVMSFYHDFRTSKAGAVTVKICRDGRDGVDRGISGQARLEVGRHVG